MSAAPPVILSIAGSDCSAGAGIQADLKIFQHLRTHGLTAITCVVSETANEVRAIHPVPAEILRDQVELLMAAFPVAAVKTGMLFSAAHVDAVAEVMRHHPQVPLVVDPVMIASTGDALLEPAAVDAYRRRLLPLATLITPNLPEAEALLAGKINGAEDLEAAARKLSEQFGTSILLKGGHLPGPDCTDLLSSGGKIYRFSTPRLDVSASHGTGCTLSAALAARLALGDELPAAVEAAKALLTETLRTSYHYLTPRGRIDALNQGTA